MQDFRPSDSGDHSAETRAYAPTPREALLVFTAGWLGGAGVLAAASSTTPMAMRVLAVAEAVAAILWFFPRLRMAGFGAMLAVLAISIVLDLAHGRPPGAVVFYAAVVAYLAVTARRKSED